MSDQCPKSRLTRSQIKPLPERLREDARILRAAGGFPITTVECEEAATEIERLLAEIERLRKSVIEANQRVRELLQDSGERDNE